MSAPPDAIDESWSRLSPAECKRRGIKLVYGYMSHDPSKNFTPADIRGYHAVGTGVWLGWESSTGRPLLGAAAGTDDGRSAAAQLEALFRGVGYAPKNRQSIPYSMDEDVSPANWPPILAYYTAAAKAHPQFDAGAYGEASLIEFLHSRGFTRGMFQTYAWSGGVRSQNADLYQYLNGQTVAGASVDFDRIIDAAGIGAWWPPGHPLDSGNQTQLKGFLMDLSADQQAEMYHVLHFLGAAFEGSGIAGLKRSGEFGLTLRALGDNFGHLATDADLKALGTAGPVDVNALAQQLAARLGPDLAPQLIAALGAALTKGA